MAREAMLGKRQGELLDQGLKFWIPMFFLKDEGAVSGQALHLVELDLKGIGADLLCGARGCRRNAFWHAVWIVAYDLQCEVEICCGNRRVRPALLRQEGFGSLMDVLSLFRRWEKREQEFVPIVVAGMRV